MSERRRGRLCSRTSGSCVGSGRSPSSYRAAILASSCWKNSRCFVGVWNQSWQSAPTEVILWLALVFMQLSIKLFALTDAFGQWLSRSCRIIRRALWSSRAKPSIPSSPQLETSSKVIMPSDQTSAAVVCFSPLMTSLCAQESAWAVNGVVLAYGA